MYIVLYLNSKICHCIRKTIISKNYVSPAYISKNILQYITCIIIGKLFLNLVTFYEIIIKYSVAQNVSIWPCNCIITIYSI